MIGDEIDGIIESISRLPTDVDHISADELARRMRGLVQAKSMLEAALSEHAAAFDARAGARRDGQSSTGAWLRSHLHLGAQADHLLRVGRHLPHLPQAEKAFTAGEITLEHATAMAHLADAVESSTLLPFQDVLVDLAKQASPAPLRTACDHLRQLIDPAGDEQRAARHRRARYLSAGRTLHGMVHIQGLLEAEAGDVLLTALRAATPPPTEHEERSPAQRRADALTDICAEWLATPSASTGGGLPPQVQVTVSLERLRREATSTDSPDRLESSAATGTDLGGALGDVPVLADQTPVPASVARRMACDAAVIPVVLGGDGEPLDIGRRTRVVPAGMRRALQIRDGGCRFAGCDRPASWCDAHHLRPWADGGETSLSNLILLCRFHHSLIHEGWRVRGDPAGSVSFRRPDGTALGISSQPRSQPVARVCNPRPG